MPRAIRDALDLTEEQQELIRLARDFAEREIRPRAAEVDEADVESPLDLWESAAKIGLTHFMLPEEYGGGGVTDLLTQVLVQEELCYGDISIGNFLTSNGFFAGPIEALGTEEQKRKWLGMLCTERPPITALAVTEPGVGSDAAALQTRAVRQGDHYVLNGQKTWISNAPYAEYFIIFATIDPSLRSKGVTAFVVPRNTPGLSVGKPMRKMGQRGIVNAEVFLDDVRVPVENRLGDEGQGFYGLMRTFDASRILIGASATGLARAALDAALQYAKERRQFGTAIINHQAVAFRLADMAAKVDTAHLLTVRAARLYDQGLSVTEEASMAKLVASENASWVTAAALQTHGGWGYSREFPLERWMRDAKLEEIEEGTSDIQRLIISRRLAAAS
ncbi:acyl-CoA dehydrogenase [Thermobispora bispora]|jgi:acyl-CoA dehydrogenase|uniref:Acyl-CoA dehydrogenase domain protein n=1 Tax=Thermobispora bispora (strain ATCC 19993 / DSM 43833 / CBS 139.67 / JCM 10125 / KCTC 9307 / NBRC 14880 / R51) TaxID=469371 RepID=D6YAT3_THEBD|nr:acyl-CoA dehydrogenase family protein [Thermobispora bispora]MBO2475418.1 acyl-CoA dehydrogenase [Actinomycetales bacterium]MDI9581713.1 acyl-CoA dehydrogenase family protein [Thermobispora sp.]ADG88300.1 acyl-CoA dehydrogenase domain protein [Thermobispora bispora DSM 43833]MBX6166944.1 acyl-CoA dehydrogenase family protein [Thermobispora bispora]QSI48126.1 acyl-CoA dehydrogenase [Thermobispora bispora]